MSRPQETSNNSQQGQLDANNLTQVPSDAGTRPGLARFMQSPAAEDPAYIAAQTLDRIAHQSDLNGLIHRVDEMMKRQ